MSYDTDTKQETLLQSAMGADFLSDIPGTDFSATSTTKIPLANLAALGVAFQPLTSAIQTALSDGGSGIYYVNTMGKQMFQFHGSTEFLGALKAADGTVGGGQARLAPLACDPTMLFMAVALMNIEKKLDSIQGIQEEILGFLEEKERATLQGNLNTLGDVMCNYKYNWDNDTYRTNKHILVQQIRKEAEGNILLYRKQINNHLGKRSSIHSDKEVARILKKLQSQFKDYQLAVYLYAYAAFLEILLLGNFDKAYLDNMEQQISEYSYQYQALYTDCYDWMDSYSQSSIQARIQTGFAAASKLMGGAITKIPIISSSQLDENLIEAGDKMDRRREKHTTAALWDLVQVRGSLTQPFSESIRIINNLHNKPVPYLFDKENIYIPQIA